MEEKNNLKEKFEKRLHAVDMTPRLKPYRKSLSATINEKATRRSIGKGISEK
ncbi:MAG: hypothetical protein ACUX7D_08065 [Candidatus Methanodesulfokora washburnensis]|jgi:hypothetical protein